MTQSLDKPDWQQRLELALEKASNRNRAGYVQLATYDRERGAQVRTLVFRGFSKEGYGLLMCSDARSAKMNELANDPRAQIAWYFADAREQFRLSGVLSADNHSVRDGCERVEVWRRMSPRARAAFFRDPFGVPDEMANEFAARPVPPESFVLLLLTVTEVEHLNIASEPHQRTRFNVDTRWSSTRVPL